MTADVAIQWAQVRDRARAQRLATLLFASPQNASPEPSDSAEAAPCLALSISAITRESLCDPDISIEEEP